MYSFDNKPEFGPVMPLFLRKLPIGLTAFRVSSRYVVTCRIRRFA
jgi:hypothetical protein